MTAQAFLERFRHRETDSAEFFYGMEQQEPYSPLLFMRQHPPASSFSTSIFELPNLGLPGLEISTANEILDQSEQIPYVESVRKLLFCATETHMRRISTRKCQCTLCGRKLDITEKFQHMVSRHLGTLPDILEEHTKILNDDVEDMTAFMMKLEFEPLMQYPTKPFPLQRRTIGMVPAPAIKPVIGDTTPEDLRKPEPSQDPTPIEVKLRGVCAPGLKKFVTKNMSRPKGQCEIDIAKDSAFKAAEVLTGDLFEKTYLNPPMFEAKKAPPPEEQPAKRETPTNTRGPSPKQQPQKNPKPEPRQQPAPKPAPPPQTKLPPESDIDALDVETGSTSRVPQKARKARPVPFIEQIPESVRDEVMKNLTSKFIKTYVTGQCQQVVRVILQKKKKQVREAQRWKVKQQRETEKRNRKQGVVDRLSQDMCNSLIRSFIRQEVSQVYEEAVEEAREEVEIPIEETKDGIPPVIVSGLPYYRYPTSSAIYDLFRAYNFAVDDDGSPKIRYRFNGSRYDVLLYLRSKHDVNRLISQRTIQVEYSSLKLSLDDPANVNDNDLVTSYTGQEIRVSPTAKNLENVAGNKGYAVGFSCPVACGTFGPNT